jgi:hypothetical protein
MGAQWDGLPPVEAGGLAPRIWGGGEASGPGPDGFVVEYRFRPWPERSARLLSLWPGRAGLVQPYAPPGHPSFETGPSPEAASHGSPGGPGANLRTGGGFGFPPMDRFTSPVLTLSRPAQTFVRPVAPHNRPHHPSGRQLDVLPRGGARRSMRAVLEGVRRFSIVTLGAAVRALNLVGTVGGYPREGAGIGAFGG